MDIEQYKNIPFQTCFMTRQDQSPIQQWQNSIEELLHSDDGDKFKRYYCQAFYCMLNPSQEDRFDKYRKNITKRGQINSELFQRITKTISQKFKQSISYSKIQNKRIHYIQEQVCLDIINYFNNLGRLEQDFKFQKQTFTDQLKQFAQAYQKMKRQYDYLKYMFKEGRQRFTQQDLFGKREEKRRQQQSHYQQHNKIKILKDQSHNIQYDESEKQGRKQSNQLRLEVKVNGKNYKQQETKIQQINNQYGMIPRQQSQLSPINSSLSKPPIGNPSAVSYRHPNQTRTNIDYSSPSLSRSSHQFNSNLNTIPFKLTHSNNLQISQSNIYHQQPQHYINNPSHLINLQQHNQQHFQQHPQQQYLFQQYPTQPNQYPQNHNYDRR